MRNVISCTGSRPVYDRRVILERVYNYCFFIERKLGNNILIVDLLFFHIVRVTLSHLRAGDFIFADEFKFHLKLRIEDFAISAWLSDSHGVFDITRVQSLRTRRIKIQNSTAAFIA